VPDICHFLLSSNLESVFNFCSDVEVAHFFEVEVPSIIVRRVALMTLAVLISSSVSEPDIISGAGCNECRSNRGSVSDPAICRVEDTVLEIDDLLSSGGHTIILKAIDSKHRKNVAIRGGDHVLFEVEAVLLHYLLERPADISINCGI
jgi:hypothetical protein